jgi:hypothetical protein
MVKFGDTAGSPSNASDAPARSNPAGPMSTILYWVSAERLVGAAGPPDDEAEL